MDSAHKDSYNYDVATRQGLIVGTYDLGCVGGAFAAFVVGGWLGRKKSIWIGTVIMMFGAFLQTFSIDYPMMVSGRYAAPTQRWMSLTLTLYKCDSRYRKRHKHSDRPSLGDRVQ